MNIIVSDPKTGRAYSKKTEQAVFDGRKIGDTVQLEAIGLAGYKALIAGGSDKDGFPMRNDLPGPRRKKLLVSKGLGFDPHMHGERRRKNMRGNTVSPDTVQLNLKVITRGPRSVEELLSKTEKKEEEAE